MDFSELKNYQGFIYLNSIYEPSDSSLLLEVDRCIVNGKDVDEKAKSETTSYSSIKVDETLPIIRIVFDWYIAYSVRNEAFTVNDAYEKSKGGVFCVYSKSRYLEFIDASTIASDQHPGSFKHYGINALNHIIDVVSTEPPTISLINRTQKNDKL